jgi:hypothetical protein
LHSEPLSRLSTNHYAGRYAFLKLMAAELLGPAVPRVIFLDTDMLLNGNIGALWHHFSYMRGQQAIGLVENQSGEGRCWLTGVREKSDSDWAGLSCLSASLSC